MYQVPLADKIPQSFTKFLLQIGIIAIINGFMINLLFWSRHHEGIFWSVSYQRFSLIYAAVLLIGNGFFFISLLLIHMLAPKFPNARFYRLIWLILAVLLNDWLFRALLGADFAQLYLSRLPISIITMLWLVRWRQTTKR